MLLQLGNNNGYGGMVETLAGASASIIWDNHFSKQATITFDHYAGKLNDAGTGYVPDMTKVYYHIQDPASHSDGYILVSVIGHVAELGTHLIRDFHL